MIPHVSRSALADSLTILVSASDPGRAQDKGEQDQAQNYKYIVANSPQNNNDTL